MSESTTKAPFRLQEVRDAILANEWVLYNPANDPGTLWTWGCNGSGQLGNNTIITGSSPVQVPGTQWTKVSSGNQHTAARKSDGTLWTWGNNNGQLGDNTIIRRSSPVQVPGTQWTEVSAGNGHTAARKFDGTLWTWGQNYGPGESGGRLGDGTVVSRSSPIQVPGTQWTEVSGGGGHTAARKSDGTLWTWGYNSNGQLGNGTDIQRSSPVQVPGTQWAEVSGGGNHTAARKAV